MRSIGAGIGQIVDDVLPDEGEAGMLREVGEIRHVAGDQVVPDDDLMPLRRAGRP